MIINCFKYLIDWYRSLKTERRLQGVAAALVLGILIANPSGALELNSERIERLFGSFGLSVLKQNERVRLSSLYSVENSAKTCRTLAIVHYRRPVAHSLESAHRDIVSGASIGATLEQHGWQLAKKNRFIGEILAPEDAGRIADLMSVELPRSLAVHAYRLDAVRGSRSVPYATIIEVHHPDYLSAGALREIYADLPEEPVSAEEIREIKELALSAARR